MNRILRKIAITTGDTDGIGFEITCKALSKIPKLLLKNKLLIIFKSNDSENKHLKLLSQKYNLHNFGSFSDFENSYLKKIDFTYNDAYLDYSKKFPLIVISNNTSPADWIFEVSRLCMKKKLDAMITAPISKTLIIKSGYKEIGHTEILKSVTGVKNLYMFFLGKKFNVLLLTGHIPLASVCKKLKNFSDDTIFLSLKSILPYLAKHHKNKPLGLLGVNPHSGENSLISRGEEESLVNIFKKSKLVFEGPLVPDAAFLKKNWDKYSVFISTYHDQGLIPFKMIHGHDSGIHVTLGLPFLRTSVDHGTAKEIFGKNIANPNSMIEAIKWSLTILSNELPCFLHYP